MILAYRLLSNLWSQITIKLTACRKWQCYIRGRNAVNEKTIRAAFSSRLWSLNLLLVALTRPIWETTHLLMVCNNGKDSLNAVCCFVWPSCVFNDNSTNVAYLTLAAKWTTKKIYKADIYYKASWKLRNLNSRSPETFLHRSNQSCYSLISLHDVILCITRHYCIPNFTLYYVRSEQCFVVQKKMYEN